MKRRRKSSRINPVLFLASMLLFAVGVGIFVYPAVSNYLAERRQAEAIEKYEKDVTVLEGCNSPRAKGNRRAESAR